MHPCTCTRPHPRRRIVLTGGPHAGKTAVLELVRQYFSRYVKALSEAAGILFRGGFPCGSSETSRQCVQRAIFHVQRELEREAEAEHVPAITLCARGSLDGLAYWPGTASSFFAQVGTSQAAELSRYTLVIHLRSPTCHQGDGSSEAQQGAAAEEDRRLDERILGAWADHPRRVVVPATEQFLDVALFVLDLLRAELPPCFAGYVVPTVDDLHAARHPVFADGF